MDQDGSHEEVVAILARHPDVTSALDLMMQDMVSTLGWTAPEARGFLMGEAAILVGLIDEPGFVFEWRVMESVQQRMHDEFIHTSWPECPTHGEHPLWLTETKPWEWRCRGLSIGLGQLPKTEAHYEFPRDSARSGEPDWVRSIKKSRGPDSTW